MLLLLSDSSSIYSKVCLQSNVSHIGGVIISMLASSAVDCGLKNLIGSNQVYIIGICCFSTKHTALRRKSKDGLDRNQDNVSEWSDMSTSGLFFQ